MFPTFSRTFALALAVLAAPAVTRAQAPDTVLLNGKIFTVDDRFTIAQALAIKDGRIVKAGTSAEIAALKGPSTRTMRVLDHDPAAEDPGAGGRGDR